MRNALLPTLYPSYEEAARHCGAGYSDVVLGAVRFFKAANCIQQLRNGATGEGLIMPAAETLGMFRTICGDPTRRHGILDFGGGFALSYFLLRERGAHQLHWAVVETPLTAALGKAFETEHLRFFDSIEAGRRWLGEVDAVHTNAALQYHPTPETVLEELASLGARHIMLLRCALSADVRAVQLQESPLSENYPGPLPAGVADRPVWYPHTSMSEVGFTRILQTAGYSPVESTGQSKTFSDRATATTGGLHDSHFLYASSSQRSSGSPTS